jgi:hypothetical protein
VFGQAVELVLGDIKRYQIWTVVFVLIIGVSIWLVHMIRGKRRERALRQHIETPEPTAAPTPAGPPFGNRPPR